MTHRRSIATVLFSLAASVFLISSVSNAAIPAGYTGVPYPAGSAPKEIPGQINFREFDLGPKNMTYYADDCPPQYGATAGRTDSYGTPAFYMTNHPDKDTLYAANGSKSPYPSNDFSTAGSHWYIGASHATNFTKWTVHVAKAGKYWISSIWGGENTHFKMTISFLNGTTTVKTPQLDLPGTGNYHIWKLYRNFASIQLDTGVQVLYFLNGDVHLNQDFLMFTDDSSKDIVGIQQTQKAATHSSSFGIKLSNTLLSYTLPVSGKTRITLFDCLGKERAVLANENMKAGIYSRTMDMSALGHGIYFLELSQNEMREVIKIRR